MRTNYHSVRVVQTIKSKFIETEAKSIPLAHIYMNATSCTICDWDRHFNKKWWNAIYCISANLPT